MRDEKWLRQQLEFLLKKYFASVKISNPIEIQFGREAKYRFGSIKLYKETKRQRDREIRLRQGFGGRAKRRGFGFNLGGSKVGPQKSIITITSMFAQENVPEKVVRYTIAHELCHYAHGFSSSNKKLFKHPHHGGVVNRELKDRGAQELILAFKKWLTRYRAKILLGKTKI